MIPLKFTEPRQWLHLLLQSVSCVFAIAVTSNDPHLKTVHLIHSNPIGLATTSNNTHSSRDPLQAKWF